MRLQVQFGINSTSDIENARCVTRIHNNKVSETFSDRKILL